MKFILYRLICLVLLLLCRAVSAKSSIEQQASTAAVSYEFCGRFGDNLISYMHAKWISYKFDIPLLYRPFEYSDSLRLHDTELLYQDYLRKFKKIVTLGRGITVDCSQKRTLYMSPYFPEVAYERTVQNWPYFEVDWKDPNFRKLIFESIEPKIFLKTIQIPQGHIALAIHVREGGGYDIPFPDAQSSWPLKFPSIAFYKKALQIALAQYQDQLIYCYLFTDALDPSTLAEEIFSVIPREQPIIVEYRKTGNHHNANVLEDFFSLFKFDVLIRPESNFSIPASLLHDYDLLITPESFVVRDNQYIIDTITVSKKLQATRHVSIEN